jgi:hypothetical protein
LLFRKNKFRHLHEPTRDTWIAINIEVRKNISIKKGDEYEDKRY